MERPIESDNGSARGRGSAPPGPEEERARAQPRRARADQPWPLLARLLGIAGEVQVLASVHSDRARLRRRLALARIRAQVLGGAVLLVGAVYGAWLFVSGLTRFLDGLFEQPGLGHLVAGAAILSLGALGLWLRGAWRARVALKQALAKYARHT